MSRRYRWWALLVTVAVIFLLGRECYLILLPADAWLDRGWYAMRDKQYPAAEYAFRRARRKAPHDDVPRIALGALYATDAYPASPFGRLMRINLLSSLLRPIEYQYERRWLQHKWQCYTAANRWLHDHYGDLPVGHLWRDGWKSDPRGMRMALQAAREASVGRFDAAWKQFHILREAHAASLDRFPFWVQLLSAEVAWRTGHRAEVWATLREAPGHVLSNEWGQRYDWLERNTRLPDPHTPPTVQTWTLRDRRLLDGLSALPRGTDETLVLPAPGGAYLLTLPFLGGGSGDDVRWWQWDGRSWTARAVGDRAVIEQTLCPAGPSSGAKELFAPQAWTAWSGTTEYLAIFGTLEGTFRRLLFRLDGTVRQMGGHSPREILLHDGDLWVHEDLGFERVTPDGQVTEFRGRAVTDLGNTAELFGSPQARPAARTFLANDWQLADDARGHLWLVAWNRRNVVLRARWDGVAFVPSTAAEQAGATQAILDATGRVWMNADLPRGFRRDAWRTVVHPGAPLPNEAGYAVDRSGRVWVAGGGIAARWEAGRWVGIAAALPDFPDTVTIVAAGDGVLIPLPGRICAVK